MSGFVDLRMNRRRSADEGFWPSFTDIMTVVVMIFLMGMVVVMMQNIEVTNNMKSALLEKQKATDLAESTSQEKSRVTNKLSDAEEELARLRMLIILANDKRASTEKQLKTSEGELQTLSALYASLQTSHKTIKQEKQLADAQLDEKALLLARLQAQLNTQTQQQVALSKQLAESISAQKLSASHLAAISLQASNADQELASIRGEYSNLQVKYNKLIKPARTSKGKHIVEVFYASKDGKHVYKIKDSGQKTSRPVTESQLHAELSKYKQQHNKNLYIRLIFPEDSKLSYNDAWKFSKDILGKYDYYHAN